MPTIRVIFSILSVVGSLLSVSAQAQLTDSCKALSDQIQSLKTLSRAQDVLNLKKDAVALLAEVDSSTSESLNTAYVEFSACILNFNSNFMVLLNSEKPQMHAQNANIIAGVLKASTALVSRMRPVGESFYGQQDILNIACDENLLAGFLKSHATVFLNRWLDAASQGPAQGCQAGLMAMVSSIEDVFLKAENPYSSLKRFAENVAKIKKPENQKLVLKALVQHMIRHGFLFSGKGQTYLISAIDAQIRNNREFLNSLIPGSPEAQGVQVALAALTSKRANLSQVTFRLSLLEPRFSSALKALDVKFDNLELSNIFQDAWGNQSNQFETFGMRLRQGDLWLLVSEDGPGELFSSLAQVPDFVTHSGVLIKDYEDSFAFYYTAEMNNGLQLRPLDTDRSTRVFMRPQFYFEDGMPLKAIQKLAQFSKVYFDSRFEDGLLDSTGKVSLYCAEFIYHLYNDGFGAFKGPSQTPFDFTDLSLHFTNPLTLQNGAAIGFNLAGRFFIPDRLLDAPQLRPIDVLPSVPSWVRTQGPVDEFKKKMKLQFNNDLASLFHVKKLKDVSFVEQRKIDFVLWAQGLRGLGIKTLGRKDIPDLAELEDVNLPQHDAKYRFLKFYQVYAQAHNLINNTSSTDNVGNPIENWDALALRKYNAEIIPALRVLFVE